MPYINSYINVMSSRIRDLIIWHKSKVNFTIQGQLNTCFHARWCMESKLFRLIISFAQHNKLTAREVKEIACIFFVVEFLAKYRLRKKNQLLLAYCYLNELNIHMSRLTNCRCCSGLMATIIWETGEWTRTFRKWVSLPDWWLLNIASWIMKVRMGL